MRGIEKIEERGKRLPWLLLEQQLALFSHNNGAAAYTGHTVLYQGEIIALN